MVFKAPQNKIFFGQNCATTGTGGAVPALVAQSLALVAQYQHWWRSTGTGGAVPALVAQ